MISNGEESSVIIEMDDEGFPGLTGALNFRDEEDVVESHYLSEGNVIEVVSLLNPHGAKGFIWTDQFVRGTKVQFRKIYFSTGQQGSIIFTNSGNLYIIDPDSVRLLRNECEQLALDGCIQS
ncbi:MAG: hypothetical protein AAB632_02595 [Patescibacteria group bacterium]